MASKEAGTIAVEHRGKIHVLSCASLTVTALQSALGEKVTVLQQGLQKTKADPITGEFAGLVAGTSYRSAPSLPPPAPPTQTRPVSTPPSPHSSPPTTGALPPDPQRRPSPSSPLQLQQPVKKPPSVAGLQQQQQPVRKPPTVEGTQPPLDPTGWKPPQGQTAAAATAAPATATATTHPPGAAHGRPTPQPPGRKESIVKRPLHIIRPQPGSPGPNPTTASPPLVSAAAAPVTAPTSVAPTTKATIPNRPAKKPLPPDAAGKSWVKTHINPTPDAGTPHKPFLRTAQPGQAVTAVHQHAATSPVPIPEQQQQGSSPLSRVQSTSSLPRPSGPADISPGSSFSGDISPGSSWKQVRGRSGGTLPRAAKLSLSHERLPSMDDLRVPRTTPRESPLREGSAMSPRTSATITVAGTPPDASAAGDPAARKRREQLERAKTHLALLKTGRPGATSVSRDVRAIGNTPRWVPDEESSCCTLCSKPFTLVFRRHHCRRCGGLYCGDCTAYKLELPELQFKKPVRVCVPCFCQYRDAEEQGKTLQPTLYSSTGSQVDAQALHIGTGTFKDESKKIEEDAAAPAAADAADLPADKQERLRLKCIREIIVTEQAYLEDLSILEEVFLMPIRFTQILTAEQIQRLFSNIETIEPVHRELYQKLTDEKLTSNGQFVGEAFKSMCHYFKMYTVYCSNHDNSIALLEELKANPEFAKTLAVCQSDKRVQPGLNISSYIIKPIQRVCKYPLFLRDLISYTPETHQDYFGLIEAKEKIDEVVKYINEGKRKFEQQQKIIEIRHNIEGAWEEELVTPTRKLLLEVYLRGRDLRTEKDHEYMLYVFGEMVVIAKIVSGPIGTRIHHKPQVLKGFVPFPECKLVVIADTDQVKASFEIRRVNPDYDATKLPGFQFFAKDEKEKKDVVKLVKGLVNDVRKKLLKAAPQSPAPTAAPAASPCGSSPTQTPPPS